MKQPMTEMHAMCSECGQPAKAGETGTMRSAPTMNNDKFAKAKKPKSIKSMSDLRMAAMYSKMAK